MSYSQAIRMAIGIINAAAYAESEAIIFKVLIPQESKGFANKTLTKDDEKAIFVLRHLRSQRPPLPDGVNGIFGAKTKEPLVTIDYGDIINLTLALDEARHHAQLLLEASEAARFDGFWFKFGEQKLGMTKQQMQEVVEEYRSYKEVYEVESWFNL